MSIGAGLAAAARAGAEVEIVTVLSGDPGQVAAADASNRHAGFAIAGQAARARQAEDAAACERIGARPVWLGFSDDRNDPRPGDGVIAPAVRAALEDSDVALVGGWPLSHPDHAWLTRLALGVIAPTVRVGLFVEQPYAAWQAASREHGLRVGRLLGRPTGAPLLSAGAPWARLPAGPRDWKAKRDAAAEYRSQLPVLRHWPLARIAAYELLHAGERVTWCSVSRSRSAMEVAT